MKKPFIFILFLSFSLVAVSVIGSLLFYDDNNPNITVAEKKINKEVNYETIDKDSPTINVYNVKENKVEKINIEEYLYGVLSSEMPSTFDEEALKAQAIAARTYVIYKMENSITTGHENATVCTNSAHCQAYTSYEDLKKVKSEDWIENDYTKVKKAVDDTKGQIVVYEDQVILPLYFSTSSGKTENSKDVFSTQYPYLVSVDSPYEESSPKYSTTYSIKKSKFIQYIKSVYPQINISSDKIDKEVNIVNRTEGGCVKIIEVGNIKISGTDMRKIFNLNSANFTINYNDDEINFMVKGYGHGVGMSQWGAEGMAKKGYKYYEILLHYFKGTQIKDMY